MYIYGNTFVLYYVCTFISMTKAVNEHLNIFVHLNSNTTCALDQSLKNRFALLRLLQNCNIYFNIFTAFFNCNYL